MNREVFLKMAETESGHWWFLGRRRILASILESLRLSSAHILEVGCGTGGNLNLLSRFGKVKGMEYDEGAREIARTKHSCEIEPGFLPGEIPFPGQSFDLVALLDVLEHVHEDAESLIALHNRLRPEGWLLLTVPAFPFLFSEHDVVHHHKRRYRIRQLRRLIQNAGFSIQRSGYFNFFLFPPAFAIRLLERIRGTRGGAQLDIPWPPLNALLAFFFGLERFLWSWVKFPFGLSIYVIAKRTPGG